MTIKKLFCFWKEDKYYSVFLKFEHAKLKSQSHSTLFVCLLWVSSYFYHFHHQTCFQRGHRACHLCLVFQPWVPGWPAPAQPGPREDLQETMKAVLAQSEPRSYCLSRPYKRRRYNRPLKASTWWLSSVLDVELALGRPPWLLLRLEASSECALPCCKREEGPCEAGRKHSLQDETQNSYS